MDLEAVIGINREIRETRRRDAALEREAQLARRLTGMKCSSP
jgi:hypothetical protein